MDWVASHPSFEEAKHKKKMRTVENIMAEIKEHSLDWYLIVISTL